VVSCLSVGSLYTLRVLHYRWSW